MILIPKTKALRMALTLFFCLFIKKEIVIGIIGKTHGVRSPSRPAPKEIRKKISSEESELFVLPIGESDSVIAVSAVAFGAVPPSPMVIEKSLVRNMHLSS